MDFHCPGCSSDDLWGDGWGGWGEKIVRCESCGGRWLRDSGEPVAGEPTIDTSARAVEIRTVEERVVEAAPDRPPLEVVRPRPGAEVVRDVRLLRHACLRLLLPELARDRMAVGVRAYDFARDLGHYSPGRLIAGAHRYIHSEYRSGPHRRGWSFQFRSWYWHTSTRSDLYRSGSEAAILGLWQQERLVHELVELGDDDLWVPIRLIGVRDHATSEQALPPAPQGYWDGRPKLPPGRPPSVPLSQSGGYHPGSVPAKEQWPGHS